MLIAVEIRPLLVCTLRLGSCHALSVDAIITLWWSMLLRDGRNVPAYLHLWPV